MTKVELFELIRKAHYKEGKSIHALSRTFKIHRRTVREALASATPPPRAQVKQTKRRLLTDEMKQAIDEWLLSDKLAPKKQRHTAARIYERLVLTYGFTGQPPTIRKHVGQRRRALSLNTEGFVPQVHSPGLEAEVDWYEAQVILAGELCKVYLFEMRACYSGKEYHVAFRCQTQQAFLEGHVAAFEYFGGVFTQIRYDNLTSAVKKVLKGRKRVETEKFVLLRSHYLFEAVYCRVGIQGAHEKGGVEGGVGRFRRAHLVPVPVFENIDELNKYLLTCCKKDDGRTIIGKQHTIAEDWMNEIPALHPLPRLAFDIDEVRYLTVNKKSLVMINTNSYSVPTYLIGLSLEVRCRSTEIICWYRGKVVARHQRSMKQHQTLTVLDHYLELLHKKPGAFANSLPLQQAKNKRHWPACYTQYQARLVERYGCSEGARQMIVILLLLRDFEAKEVTLAIEQGLNLNLFSAEMIEYLVRKHRGEIPATEQLILEDNQSALADVQASLHQYDQLLITKGEIN